MPVRLRVQLSLMMLLEYVVWGAWYVTLNTYLTATLHFTGQQAGAVFGTTALASMISPFFVGRIADRFFAVERVMAALHLTGAILLFVASRTTSFAGLYAIMLAYCLCYFPTMSLANSLAFRNISDSGRQFPLIRVFGTLGWILIGLIVGSMKIESTAQPLLLAAGASVVMALFCLTLPHTPPVPGAGSVSFRTALGLDALVMLKDRSFAIFLVASVLACIPLTFYFSFTNPYLNDVGVQNAAGKMTLGQGSEVFMMLVMPFVFRRISVRFILLLGLGAWAVRYLLLAFGNAGGSMWMFYVAIALHGICFDFFFMTGQMFTDQQAPLHLRSTAQGLYTFLTYGLGMFIGSYLSGFTLDAFSQTVNGAVVRAWPNFWLICATSAAVIFLLIAIFFRSRSRIEPRPA
jgi:nucleoside transporter